MKVDKKDNNIEKFMTDYLKTEAENRRKRNKEDLIVNFDISYPDGTDESFVCAEESEVFGGNKGCIENKVEPEELKCFYGDSNIDITSDYNDRLEKNNCKDHKEENCNCDKCQENDIKIEFDEDVSKEDYEYNGKWSNCEEEIKEKVCNNDLCHEECDNDYYMNDYFEKDEKQEYKSYEDKEQCCIYPEIDNKKSVYKKSNGKIIVISTLNSIDCTRIKGVKINLYKLNGVCPELVCSKVTDCNGKAIFDNVLEGDYRIIEIINKNYFNKPVYVNWNEVRIDECSRECTIYVVNTINKNCIKKCR